MAEEAKTEKPKKSPVQILISKVDNIRNSVAMLEHRMDKSEKAIVSLKSYISSQLTEMYSQIQAASEMMDEISQFIEQFNESEKDFEIEQEIDHEGHDSTSNLSLDDFPSEQDLSDFERDNVIESDEDGLEPEEL